MQAHESAEMGDLGSKRLGWSRQDDAALVNTKLKLVPSVPGALSDVSNSDATHSEYQVPFHAHRKGLPGTVLDACSYCTSRFAPMTEEGTFVAQRS